MIFTKKQADNIIEQLRNKSHIKHALESILATLTKQMRIPVNVVNSGSKRLYENLINTTDGDANSTITTQSIQVSIGSINIDNADNVAPCQSAIIITANRIPHKFRTTILQKRLTVDLECQYITSNSLEALTSTEYIIDNLTNQQIFNYECLGIQHQGSYSLSTETFDKDIDKSFSYENTPNGVNISFTISAEIIYNVLQTGKIIDLFHRRTFVDENGNTLVDVNNETGKFNDDEVMSTISSNTGDTIGFESDNEILKYIGTVKVTNKHKKITATTKYHSSNLTEQEKEELL